RTGDSASAILLREPFAIASRVELEPIARAARKLLASPGMISGDGLQHRFLAGQLDRAALDPGNVLRLIVHHSDVASAAHVKEADEVDAGQRRVDDAVI